MPSRRVSRALLALLFLVALVCAQTASLAGEYGHSHSGDHCCALCHAGPLPFLQDSRVAAPVPFTVALWIGVPADAEFPREVLLTAGSTRAPPLTLFV